MQRKTVAEYEADAMLLGMIYDVNTHSFHVKPQSFDPAGIMRQTEYDADTLEPITTEEWTRRLMKWWEKVGIRS